MTTERRAADRTRCLFGGYIVFNGGKATMDCLVRNVTPEGALLIFSRDALVPDHFELNLPQLGGRVHGAVRWRDKGRIGAALSPVPAVRRPSPLDIAGKVRAVSGNQDGVRARVA